MELLDGVVQIIVQQTNPSLIRIRGRFCTPGCFALYCALLARPRCKAHGCTPPPPVPINHSAVNSNQKGNKKKKGKKRKKNPNSSIIHQPKFLIQEWTIFKIPTSKHYIPYIPKLLIWWETVRSGISAQSYTVYFLS